MVSTIEELTQDKHKQEDVATTRIEQMTSQVPSGTFLAAAAGCIGISAVLALSGRVKAANFVGQWVPTILILGLYNKLVKEHEPE